MLWVWQWLITPIEIAANPSINIIFELNISNPLVFVPQVKM